MLNHVVRTIWLFLRFRSRVIRVPNLNVVEALYTLVYRKRLGNASISIDWWSLFWTDRFQSTLPPVLRLIPSMVFVSSKDCLHFGDGVSFFLLKRGSNSSLLWVLADSNTQPEASGMETEGMSGTKWPTHRCSIVKLFISFCWSWVPTRG